MKIIQALRKLIVVIYLILIGCCQDETSEEIDHTVTKEKVSLQSCTNTTAQTIAEIESGIASLTSVVYNQPWKARDASVSIVEKIMTLPHEQGEKYGRKLASHILSIPIDHLCYYDRHRAISAIWEMGVPVGWPGAAEVDLWDILIGQLSRLRNEAEAAKNDNKKSMQKGDYALNGFIAYVSAQIKGYSEFYEARLTERTINEVSPEEYAVIKAKFEKFLGRPIRHYTEIHRARLEHARKMEQERERRRGGPDVKVDVGDL